MNSQFDQFNMDNMRSNPENYKWGVFYFNRKDSRVVLPRRNRMMGWTMNFASPYTYLIIIGFIVLAILMK
jgi:uncharacterized membrane protein